MELGHTQGLQQTAETKIQQVELVHHVQQTAVLIHHTAIELNHK